MKIIVVEPQKDLGDLLQKGLAQDGAEVVVVNDAQSAIYASEEGVDVVVLELALPGHNGVEFLHEFRSHSDWQDIPIIIYSHISAEEAGLGEEVYHRFGIAEHLYKPKATFQKLNDAIRGAVVETVS